MRRLWGDKLVECILDRLSTSLVLKPTGPPMAADLARVARVMRREIKESQTNDILHTSILMCHQLNYYTTQTSQVLFFAAVPNAQPKGKKKNVFLRSLVDFVLHNSC